MTFSDLVAILQAGTNVTLDVDTVAETITINSNGGTQIQSDWNQTNNTQVDYIKNKPTIPIAESDIDWLKSQASQFNFTNLGINI